jgi:glycosyltransferase involved in cell wall biosynthesis
VNILFVHQNYPGQYKHLLKWLAATGEHRIVFLTQRRNVPAADNHQILVYEPGHKAAEDAYALSRDFETCTAAGLKVANICRRLDREGFRPDIVIGHAGWGETLFVKDVWPDAPVLAYFEYFYSAVGGAVGFDPEYPVSSQMPFIMAARNATQWVALGSCDAGQTATRWQFNRYPKPFQDRMTVVHEGVDTAALQPDPAATLELGRLDRPLTRADEVLTYLARNLEPTRGFHVLMRALPDIFARRPGARAIIVGGDDVSYGRKSKHPGGFKAELMEELGDRVDWSRVHFLGRVPYDGFRRIIQVSRCHLYLSVPFVLSWSLLEAMAMGATVVAADTAAVREVITDGVNGRLVDFLRPAQIADTVCEVLAAPGEFAGLGAAARATVRDGYDLYAVSLPAQARLINTLLPARLALPEGPVSPLQP